jgi:hypothetical protein
MLRTICGVVAVMVMATLAVADPLNVDGKVGNDWGLHIIDGPSGGDDTPSNMNEYSGWTVDGLRVLFHREDTNDGSVSGPVGPYYGGQNYDAEFLGATVWADQLWVVIVSGQRPDNTESKFSPGDLRILGASANYGVEVGGGAYVADSGGEIYAGALGSTYTLFGNGYTDYVTNHASPAAGSFWVNPTWKNNDPINPATPKQINPTSPGTSPGLVDYVYTRDSFTSEHSVIEMAIPLHYFGGDEIQRLEWRPSCGNDELLLRVDLQPIPEPSSLALAALGIAGLALLRRRKR